MCRHLDVHTDLTSCLVAAVDRGWSWLDHRDAAGQLDWALLHGASTQELQQIRVSWPQHVQHLRTVHHVTVEEAPPGFFRITRAARQPETRVGDRDGGCGDDDAGDDLEGGAVAGVEATPERFGHAARALVALHQVGELTNPMHRAAVGMVIRQVSECHHWHNSAHYRSRAAAQLIAQARIETPAQYQAFCRKNLRHEHMVPNSVIYQMIMSNPNPTNDWIVNLFSRYSRRATITREEDGQLLASSMPEGFFQKGHPWFEDPLARYRLANLFEQLVERPAGGRWFPAN